MKAYRLTINPDVVVRTSDGTAIPLGHRWWDDYQSWLASGNLPDPAQTQEQALEELSSTFEQAIQSRLDAEARARGYDSIATAVSYAEEPSVAKFQEDGRAMRAWRSLVWAYAYQELAKVKSGQREIPALDAFLAELPAVPGQEAA
jgi:hypothetical protein